MKHFKTLDLLDLVEDTRSHRMSHIMAVTETPIEAGDYFYIGNYPQSSSHKVDVSGRYKVDSVIDVVEIDVLQYNIKASRIEVS